MMGNIALGFLCFVLQVLYALAKIVLKNNNSN